MSTPLLVTKLYIPPPRPNLVLRPRLSERLNEGLQRKLTLISAPAGYGKTTLASAWIAGCERLVAWLALDEADNDPARFLTYLVAALQTIAPAIGEGLVAMLQSSQPPPTEAILATLLNDITALPNRLILVLDDYHLIDTKALDTALAFLVEHQPPQMHLVIITREDPDLPLARLRARGLLPEDDHLQRGAAMALLGLASWARGDLEAAHQSYARGMARMQQAGIIAQAIGCAIALADIRIAQGRLHEAMSAYERGLLLATAHGEPLLRGTADMYVGMSELERERNDLEAASQHLLRSQELGEHMGLPQNPYRWRVALARIKEAQGDLDSALNLFEEAERRIVSDFFPNVRPVAALKTRVWLAQGRLGEALGWVRTQGLSPQDDLSYLHEFEHITLAEPEGYVRLFVDEGPPMAQLLREAAARAITPVYTDALLATFPGAEGPLRAPAVDQRFEVSSEVGVTSVLYYDVLEQRIRSDASGGSYRRVAFSPWHTAAYDANDTLNEAGNGWLARMSGSNNAAERPAPQGAVAHADMQSRESVKWGAVHGTVPGARKHHGGENQMVRSAIGCRLGQRA